MMWRATEIIYLLGLVCFTMGIVLLLGFAYGLTAAGSVLLITAFRNAAERERGA